MDNFDQAQICLNGHVITPVLRQFPQLRKKFCKHCGMEGIDSCSNCSESIPGHEIFDFTLTLSEVSDPDVLDYTPPKYCENCGAPFPWTVKNIELLNNAIIETDLDDANKKELMDITPNLTTDTSESEVSISKFKRILSMAGKKSQEMVENILAKVITETHKSTYFG